MGGDPMMLALDVEPMGGGDWRWRWYDHDSGATLADGVERGERSAWIAALTHYVERSDECVRALAARAEAAEAALAAARAEVAQAEVARAGGKAKIRYLERELGRVETYWRKRLWGAQ